VDRHFTDRFFEENRPFITGNVLEIQNRVYAARFGQGVRRLDTVDIDSQFQPTIVCDLSEAEAAIPSDQYDCFLLPYTLPFIANLEGALRNAMRVVKPGGTVLATASVIAPIFAEYPEYWRMTEHGWRETLARAWPGCDIDVRTYGNCVSGMASVLGLAKEELKPRELEREDPRFPVLISIRGRKATG